MSKITEKMLSDLSDNSDILEYINQLESDIDKDTEIESDLDSIIRNLLSKFDNFKDFRAVRASNISAINELIRTKKEFRDSRLDRKKALLDLVMKKRATDSKNSTLLAIEDGNQMDFKTLLVHLDQMNIHPVITDKELQKAEMLIDTEKEVLSISAPKEDETEEEQEA